MNPFFENIDRVNRRQLFGTAASGVGVAALAILVTIGIYLAGTIRAKAVQKEPSASDLLTKFREMHSRGVLSDEEFRTIKTTLTERLQAELRDKDETG